MSLWDEYVLAKEINLYGPREKAVWKLDTGRLSPLFYELSFVLYPTTAMSWSSALVEGLLESPLKQAPRSAAAAPLR